MFDPYNKYEECGEVFIQELSGKLRNWRHIEQQLEDNPAILETLKPQDFYGIYKYAVIDKKPLIIEKLHNFHKSKDKGWYLKEIDVLFNNKNIWSIAFEVDDYPTVQALCGYKNFSWDFIKSVFSDPDKNHSQGFKLFITELMDKKRFNTLEALVDRGLPLEVFDSQNTCLLSLASVYKKAKLVEKILDKGFPVDYQNYDSENNIKPSALHNAFVGNPDFIKDENWTPQDSQDFIATLQALFKHKANPNLIDKYNNSPLFYFMYMPPHCTHETLVLFIENGVDFNQVGSYDFNLLEQFQHVYQSMRQNTVFHIHAKEILQGIEIMREKYAIEQSFSTKPILQDNQSPFKI